MARDLWNDTDAYIHNHNHPLTSVCQYGLPQQIVSDNGPQIYLQWIYTVYVVKWYQTDLFSPLSPSYQQSCGEIGTHLLSKPWRQEIRIVSLTNIVWRIFCSHIAPFLMLPLKLSYAPCFLEEVFIPGWICFTLTFLVMLNQTKPIRNNSMIDMLVSVCSHQERVWWLETIDKGLPGSKELSLNVWDWTICEWTELETSCESD